jgi:hypothetical protein
MNEYIHTMQNELHRLGPPPPPSQRQTLRKRRDVLLKQALKDSIVNSTEASIALRASVAEEVIKGLEGLLTKEERDPANTLLTTRTRGKAYWSKVHQEFIHSGLELRNFVSRQPMHHFYSTKDIEKILFFWAIHQKAYSYGEIAYELCLPLGVLLSWIMRYVDRM